MPWVRFKENFDWKPSEKVMVAYRKGTVHLVHSTCAEQAVNQGRADIIERPDNMPARKVNFSPNVKRR